MVRGKYLATRMFYSLLRVITIPLALRRYRGKILAGSIYLYCIKLQEQDSLLSKHTPNRLWYYTYTYFVTANTFTTSPDAVKTPHRITELCEEEIRTKRSFRKRR